MLLLLSPAKKQTFSPYHGEMTKPFFEDKTKDLVLLLQNKTADELKSLMRLSDALAELNFDRYQTYDQSELNPAVFAFQGDVYRGLDVASIDPKHYKFMQNHVAILSGLYGVLRPLDRIHPHRLEMGTKLENSCGSSLYDFWQESVTQHVNKLLSQQSDPVLINAASKEYSNAVDFSKINYPVIHLDFKVDKGDGPKTIGIYAKKARGLMARFLIENEVDSSQALKSFASAGYKFTGENGDEWIYTLKK